MSALRSALLLALGAVAMTVSLAACSLFYPNMGYGTDAMPYAKDSWESEREPLIEVAPLAHEPDWVTFTSTDHTMLGMEGYVVFVRLEDAGGSVVVDHRVTGEFTSTLDTGTYAVTGYYRNCEGNCLFLDPPEELCTTTLDLVAGQSPTVIVSVEHRTCTVESG